MNQTRSKVDLNRPLILDGGTGAELAVRGWQLGSCLESWANEHPEVVAGVHREFVEAGAGLVLTCTFGANRYRLGAYQRAGHVRELNRRSVEIAREAAGSSGALIAGDIGPSGERYEMLAEDRFSSATHAYAEQARALIEAGVDLLYVETMLSLGEAQAALMACRRALDDLGVVLPVVVSLTFGDSLTLADRVGPEEVYAALRDEGADAIGCNCTPVGGAMVDLIQRMRTCGNLPLTAKPSAGIPRIVEGTARYPLHPDDLARLGKRLREAGASWVGGCCGASPAHIRALADALGA